MQVLGLFVAFVFFAVNTFLLTTKRLLLGRYSSGSLPTQTAPRIISQSMPTRTAFR